VRGKWRYVAGAAHHEPDPKGNQQGTAVASVTRKDLLESEPQPGVSGTGGRPAYVEGRGSGGRRDGEPDRGSAGVNVPIRRTSWSGERLAAGRADPKHPV